jgi:hypothetical protein
MASADRGCEFQNATEEEDAKMTWVNISDDEAMIIAKTPILETLHMKIEDQRNHLTAYAPQIEEARDEYATTDDVEIDDEPSISNADNGVWVMAWLWISIESEEDDEETVE